MTKNNTLKDLASKLRERARWPSGEEFAGAMGALDIMFQNKLIRGQAGLETKRKQAESTEPPPFYPTATPTTPQPTSVAPANITPAEREAILAKFRVPTTTPTPLTPAPGELGGPAKITRKGPTYLESGGKTYLLKEGKRIDVTPPKKITSFGVGKKPAYIKPELFDELMKIDDETIRMALAELAGQESSYGYAGPQISDVEESYGPFHINLMAGRVNPQTGKAFTRKEAEDWELATQYALQEFERTGGLGKWNPGAYPFYQEELPKRAKTKKFIRGK